jgi:hypothetical protein
MSNFPPKEPKVDPSGVEILGALGGLGGAQLHR